VNSGIDKVGAAIRQIVADGNDHTLASIRGDIASEIDHPVSASRVSRHLTTLVNAGEVSRVARGVYRLPTDSEEPATPEFDGPAAPESDHPVTLESGDTDGPYKPEVSDIAVDVTDQDTPVLDVEEQQTDSDGDDFDAAAHEKEELTAWHVPPVEDFQEQPVIPVQRSSNTHAEEALAPAIGVVGPQLREDAVLREQLPQIPVSHVVAAPAPSIPETKKPSIWGKIKSAPELHQSQLRQVGPYAAPIFWMVATGIALVVWGTTVGAIVAVVVAVLCGAFYWRMGYRRHATVKRRARVNGAASLPGQGRTGSHRSASLVPPPRSGSSSNLTSAGR